MMANDTTIVKVTQRGEQIFPTHSHTYNILATTSQKSKDVMSLGVEPAAIIVTLN